VLPVEIHDAMQRERDSCHAPEMFTSNASAPVFERREIAEVHVNEQEDQPQTEATSQVLKLELAGLNIQHTTISHYSIYLVHDSFSSRQALTAELLCGSMTYSLVVDIRDVC
jgi:hypothetical protein